MQNTQSSLIWRQQRTDGSGKGSKCSWSISLVHSFAYHAAFGHSLAQHIALPIRHFYPVPKWRWQKRNEMVKLYGVLACHVIYSWWWWFWLIGLHIQHSPLTPFSLEFLLLRKSQWRYGTESRKSNRYSIAKISKSVDHDCFGWLLCTHRTLLFPDISDVAKSSMKEWNRRESVAFSCGFPKINGWNSPACILVHCTGYTAHCSLIWHFYLNGDGKGQRQGVKKQKRNAIAIYSRQALQSVREINGRSGERLEEYTCIYVASSLLILPCTKRNGLIALDQMFSNGQLR